MRIAIILGGAMIAEGIKGAPIEVNDSMAVLLIVFFIMDILDLAKR